MASCCRPSYHPEYGNLIDVDHGEGLTSRYAHLSAWMSTRRWSSGRALGAVGTTGRSTGPHLHFEVRMLGVAQNPGAISQAGRGIRAGQAPLSGSPLP
jgi:murein DD-endopeptidase MepM/ murein hydrolase activator NlpD